MSEKKFEAGDVVRITPNSEYGVVTGNTTVSYEVITEGGTRRWVSSVYMSYEKYADVCYALMALKKTEEQTPP